MYFTHNSVVLCFIVELNEIALFIRSFSSEQYYLLHNALGRLDLHEAQTMLEILAADKFTTTIPTLLRDTGYKGNSIHQQKYNTSGPKLGVYIDD